MKKWLLIILLFIGGGSAEWYHGPDHAYSFEYWGSEIKKNPPTKLSEGHVDFSLMLDCCCISIVSEDLSRAVNIDEFVPICYARGKVAQINYSSVDDFVIGRYPAKFLTGTLEEERHLSQVVVLKGSRAFYIFCLGASLPEYVASVLCKFISTWRLEG